MQKESEKNRVKRRMADLNECPGKERVVICGNCQNNDETCSMCVSCISGSNFEQKANENDEPMTIAEAACHTAKRPAATPEQEQHYRKGSIVSKRKAKIDELVSSHWGYVKEVIRSGADTKRTFSFDEVMAMREWDYTSAAKHFYGHGFEDGLCPEKEA